MVFFLVCARSFHRWRATLYTHERILYICSIIIYERSNFRFFFLLSLSLSPFPYFSRFLVTSCKQIFCIYWLVLDTSYTRMARCTQSSSAPSVSGVRRRFFAFRSFLFIHFFSTCGPRVCTVSVAHSHYSSLLTERTIFDQVRQIHTYSSRK